MAEKPSLTTSALVKLEKQLTCSICHGLYTNPRTLPCLHSFCQQCLEGLQQDPQGDLHFITCPGCHHRTQLPEQGATEFPVAFQLNNLQEVYVLLKKVSNTQELKCDNCGIANATGHCEECNQFLCQKCIVMHNKWSRFTNHKIADLDEVAKSALQLVPTNEEEVIENCLKHNEPFEMFCEECKVLICSNCLLRVHKGHKHDSLDASYNRCHKMIESKLKMFSDKIAAVSDVLTSIIVRENEIKEQREAIKEKIHFAVEEAIDHLCQSERQLTKEVDTITAKKLQVLSEQKKSAESCLSELKEGRDFVEQKLKDSAPQHFLMLLKKMTILTDHPVQLSLFQPVEVANVQFIKDRSVLDETCHIGDIVFYSSSPSIIQQCTVKKVAHSQLTKKGKIMLSLQFLNSSLVAVPPTSLSCSVVPVGTETPIVTMVTTTAHPGVYTIHCNQSTNGDHNINVRVNDIPISSASITIPYAPHLESITPLCIIPNLNKPCDVIGMDDGRFLVTERDDPCVTIFDKNRKKVKSIGNYTIKFYQPSGLTVTPDNTILVADHDKLRKISLHGSCIETIKTIGPIESIYPWDIAVSPVNGRVYVTDYKNHRILIMNSDLTFLDTFGCKGSAEGQFARPKRIAINKKGLVYVTDYDNHRIQIFTPDGQFLSQFGMKGYRPGELYYPEGIVVDNNFVYIAESDNHRISIFTTEGQFVHCFGEKGNKEYQFNSPNGIMLDNEGRLYVCDYSNNRLVVFKVKS